jgi:hypothetical protein
MVVIRAPHGRRSRSVKVAASHKTPLETALLVLARVGFVVPTKDSRIVRNHRAGWRVRESRCWANVLRWIAGGGAEVSLCSATRDGLAIDRSSRSWGARRPTEQKRIWVVSPAFSFAEYPLRNGPLVGGVTCLVAPP